ncbi:hypothetical protein KIN20_007116 [Parelaphostrongylus tenuis]|uniref:Uncharacterized protein n=1 Tax=Parelaphostrongylus tenuis TaxID=148309 RepID=A0AAD5M605_PARTN|nr:hypothetical protein KIN20_007116 [Parelaphostrongylus tenuis]
MTDVSGNEPTSAVGTSCNIDSETPVIENLNQKAGECPSATSSTPQCSLDEMFSDRYTTNNQSYAKITEGFDPVICLYPFYSKPKHFERNRPRHGSGAWAGSHEPRTDWNHGYRGDNRSRHSHNKRQRPSWSHHQ